jgi:hypothetical protein
MLLKRIFQTDDVSSALATYGVEEKLLTEKFKVLKVITNLLLHICIYIILGFWKTRPKET